MSDPFLTFIATLIVIVAIGASAIMFVVLAPSAVEWQKGLLAMRPKPPKDVAREQTGSNSGQGGISRCPVCHRWTKHTKDCPMNGLLRLGYRDYSEEPPA